MPAFKSQRKMSWAAVVACYNAVPSVLWSGLALGPLVVGYYRYVAQL